MSDLYGFAQAVSVNQFRDGTLRHAKMAGVTVPSFICRTCKKRKPAEGSRWVDPSRKGGRDCVDCAPPVAESEPASSKKPTIKRSDKNPEKPAKVQAMTDAQVLEAREEHEFNNVRSEVLARRYGVKVTYMRQVLDYAVRSKLIPARYRK